MTATVTVVSASTNYVSRSGSHTHPYDTWAKAAHDIQAAVDAVGSGGTVLVTNGVYDTGGALINSVSNRVAVKGDIVVRSLNGPEHTAIVGEGPVGASGLRCAYVADGESGLQVINVSDPTNPIIVGPEPLNWIQLDSPFDSLSGAS